MKHSLYPWNIIEYSFYLSNLYSLPVPVSTVFHSTPEYPRKPQPWSYKCICVYTWIFAFTCMCCLLLSPYMSLSHGFYFIFKTMCHTFSLISNLKKWHPCLYPIFHSLFLFNVKPRNHRPFSCVFHIKLSQALWPRLECLTTSQW